MPTTAKIAIILVNYNANAFNELCLNSCIEYPQSKVFFVDNASTDGSLEEIQEIFGNKIEYLPQTKNLLFAAGCNKGIKAALDKGVEYIFILNNDTVLSDGCLDELLSYLQNTALQKTTQNLAGVQPLLVQMNDPTKVASAGCLISCMGGCWDNGYGKNVDTIPLLPFSMPAITGGAMLWRADVLRQIGLFDESFGMYFEDVDLCLRARKAGYDVQVVPRAKILHACGGSSCKKPTGFTVYYCQANALRIIVKHWPSAWLCIDMIIWFCTSCLALTSNILGKNWCIVSALFRGMLRGILHLPKGLILRWKGVVKENEILKPWINRNNLYPPAHEQD